MMAASPRSRAQVAAVLAFVISLTTFLAAQDDETGRCPKVLWITGFPFGVYKHGPPDRERKRFEGFARNDDTGEPNVS